MDDSDEDPEVLLNRLQAEEKAVSAQRRRLHERLSSFSNEVTRQHERELSARRRELHAQIDALRVEVERRRRQA